MTSTQDEPADRAGDRAGSNAARLHWPVFGIAFVVALLVTFVLWKSQKLVATQNDPYDFVAMGRSVARGEGFSGHGTLLHRRSPLFPLLVAAIYFVFGEHEFLIKLVQFAFFALTCVLAYDLGRRIYNPRTGIVAALFCVLHPSLLRYVPDFHVETMLTFFFTLSIWCSVRFVERPSFPRAAWFGFTSALSALTKAVTLAYPAVFAGIWLFLQWRASSGEAVSTGPQRSKARLTAFASVALMFVTMGLTIVPWTIRNYYATGGHIVPISTGLSDAFLRGYVFSRSEFATLRLPPYTYAEIEVNKLFNDLCKAEGTVWQRDDLETDKILSRAAKARLLASPGDFVRKFSVGLFTFWYEMTSLPTSLAAGVMALGAWVLAVIGLKRARRERRRAWLLLAPIFYLNLLLAALLALGRYSVPILPCLLVLAAFGVDTLLGDRLLPWERRRVA